MITFWTQPVQRISVWSSRRLVDWFLRTQLLKTKYFSENSAHFGCVCVSQLRKGVSSTLAKLHYCVMPRIVCCLDNGEEEEAGVSLEIESRLLAHDIYRAFVC